MRTYHISIYHDKRRKKSNGKYPVKLRVFTHIPRKQKLYTTIFEFDENEFKSIWETTKPRKEYKPIRLKLQSIENRANEIAENLNPFDFETFERLMYGGLKAKNNSVAFYYENAIAYYKRNNRIGTASNYEFSLKSLLEFHGKATLNFHHITPQWLHDYERHMTEVKKRSITTVGIYLRPLRRIFNTAIKDRVITAESYPFRKGDYTIPAPKSVKKALSREQLKILFQAEPETPEQKKAKAFWFFSYSCNGMNIKDMAYLQYKNISDDTLVFRRSKTARTKRDHIPVQVPLTEFAFSVIKKYGNRKTSPETYLFPIVDHISDPETQYKQLKNFIRYVNQHFLKFAKSVGIEEKVSSYWARHSFATNAIRSGASMEFVSEALNHSNLKTTQSYFAGFRNDHKRKIAESLLNFE